VAPYLASLQDVEEQVGAHDPALLEWLQQAERRSLKQDLSNKTKLGHVGSPNERMF